MKMFEYFDRYLVDKDYKITTCRNQVHIMNYLEIEDFSSTRVVVKYRAGKNILLGNHLVVSKMQDEELLIVGELKSIEYN